MLMLIFRQMPLFADSLMLEEADADTMLMLPLLPTPPPLTLVAAADYYFALCCFIFVCLFSYMRFSLSDELPS